MIVINAELKKEIDDRLSQVYRLVAEAAEGCGRDPNKIRIVGVSKKQTPARLAAAILAGLREIGENRIQEMQTKRPVVERILAEEGFDAGTLNWHMVGQLQTNKVVKAVDLFDTIQSLDSVKLARKLSRIAVDRGKEIDCFIEVNISGETSKAGVKPAELDELVSTIASLPALGLKGLMTIGPLTDDRERIRDAFISMRRLRDDFTGKIPGLSGELELSMGMSGDFQLAIESGADVVRIGTSIFGPRPIDQAVDAV